MCTREVGQAAAARPLPELIRLSSPRDICREINLSEGKSKSDIKNSLYQNASAFITAKISYTGADRNEHELEFGSTRYSVIFTGESLPDGRRADAVYVLLNDLYRELLDRAMRRPLDYGYLKMLGPSAQRFYELASYQIYAVLKHDRPRARLRYSEYCTYAPQTRYYDFEHVKKQMYKVHRPHIQNEYLAKAEFEATTDADGNPDWYMLYTPGQRARSQYDLFGKRADASSPSAPKRGASKGDRIMKGDAGINPKFASTLTPDPPRSSETDGEQEQVLMQLLGLGVSEPKAREIVTTRLDAAREQLAALPHRKYEDAAAFLVSAIENGYTPPSAVKRDRDREGQRRKTTARESCQFCGGRGYRYVDKGLKNLKPCTHDPEQESKYTTYL